MRPAHIRFGQGKTQDESDLNQISYRKAQISVYTKGIGNRIFNNETVSSGINQNDKFATTHRADTRLIA
jgi:hypothetical protein